MPDQPATAAAGEPDLPVYKDTCAQLPMDPVKLLAEIGRLLADLRGLLAPVEGAAGAAPETVTIPAQPPVAPVRRPR